MRVNSLSLTRMTLPLVIYPSLNRRRLRQHRLQLLHQSVPQRQLSLSLLLKLLKRLRNQSLLLLPPKKLNQLKKSRKRNLLNLLSPLLCPHLKLMSILPSLKSSLVNLRKRVTISSARKLTRKLSNISALLSRHSRMLDARLIRVISRQK